MDIHRAPAEAVDTRWGRAAVAGDAHQPRRDTVDPVGELPRDHDEAAAPADLDTGRNSCLGILATRSGVRIPPEGTRALRVV